MSITNISQNLETIGVNSVKDSTQSFLSTTIPNSNNLKDTVTKVGLNNVNNQIPKYGITDAKTSFTSINSGLDSNTLITTQSLIANEGANIPLVGGSKDATNLTKSLSVDSSYLNNPVGLPNSLSQSSLPIMTDPTLIPSSDTASTTSKNIPPESSTLPEIFENNLNGAPNSDKLGSIYQGIDYSGKSNVQTTTQALIDYQQELYNGSAKTNSIKTPWDWRMIGTYTNSQSIGNSMPYGPEWVGSPSLMNKLALIRFDHIASNKHHTYLLDQANSQSLRYGGAKPKYIKVVDTKGTTNTDEKINVNDRGQLENKYPVLKDSLSISVDPNSGQVSYTKEDKTIKVYKDSSGNDVLIQQNENGTFPDPKTPEYWYAQAGWVKCKVEPNADAIYVLSQYCDNGSFKVPEGTTSADIAQLKKEISDVKYQEKLRSDVAKKTADSQNWSGGEFLVQEFPLMENKIEEIQPTSGPGQMVEMEPTPENLVNLNNWLGKEQFAYDWTDFLYCKYYGLIPTNRLITLRRFPVPIGDNGRIPLQDLTGKFITPIVKAVTYIGEEPGNKTSELYSFTTKMNWEEVKADVQNVAGNEQDMDGMFGEGKYGKSIEKLFRGAHTAGGVTGGSGNFNQMAGWDEARAKFDPYDGGPYANRVYGPVNAITSTLKRARGLEFEQNLKLKFHYSLKSLGGINPKAALLDILANMLALTYNNAQFWGGAIRYFPNKPSYPMPGGALGANQYLQGNVTGFLDTAVTEISESLGGLADTLMNIFKDPIGTLKTIAQGAGKFAIAKNLHKSGKRPEILKFKALLTGEPIGEWHLMVGDPFRPDLMIGNLVVESAQFSFSDDIGVDNFPDDLTVEVNLKHGKPRDKGDIESMFNRGGGRLHYSYFGEQNEAWNNASSTRNSKIDRPPSTGDIDVNGGGPLTAVNLKASGVTGGISGKGEIGVNKLYTNTSHQAIELAQRMGFKSGSQTDHKSTKNTTP